MLEAMPASVRFCCPSCGATMRCASRDGGTVQSCGGCGEAIRVPRQQHPRECDGPDAPAASAQALAAARDGLRLLTMAHVLVLTQAALVVSAYALWAVLEGTAKVVERDPGPWRELFVAIWLSDLMLLALQSGLKWQGYQRFDAAAAAVGSIGWLALGRSGVLLRGVGYLLASAPWLMANTPEADAGLVKVFAQLGHLTLMAGLLFEYGVLVVWYHLLSDHGGVAATAPVSRYVAWTAGVVLTAAACVSLTAMTLILLLRQHTDAATPHQGVRLDFAHVPPEGWAMVVGLVTLLVGFAAVLAVRYWGVLTRLERALQPRG